MTFYGLASGVFIAVTVTRFLFGWLSDKYDPMYAWEVTPDRELFLCITVAVLWGNVSGYSWQEIAAAAALASFATALFSLTLLLRSRLVSLLMQARR